MNKPYVIRRITSNNLSRYYISVFYGTPCITTATAIPSLKSPSLENCTLGYLAGIQRYIAIGTQWHYVSRKVRDRPFPQLT